MTKPAFSKLLRQGSSVDNYPAVNLSMSKTFIGGAVCREFELQATAAEEMLDHVVCSREQFSFQMFLESGDGSGTFRNWRQRVPDSWWPTFAF